VGLDIAIARDICELQEIDRSPGARKCAGAGISARDHQFLELGRFAVTYRTTFGESPSVTLQRDL
jgi:hypothetical protein